MIDVSLDVTKGAPKPLQGMVSLSCDREGCDAVLFVGLVPKVEGMNDAVDAAIGEASWAIVDSELTYCAMHS